MEFVETNAHSVVVPSVKSTAFLYHAVTKSSTDDGFFSAKTFCMSAFCSGVCSFLPKNGGLPKM